MGDAAVLIRVDSRLRLSRAEVPPAVLDRLREATTYADPAHAKMARMAQRNRRLAWRLKGMAAQVQTWAETTQEFSLPRGAFARLRAALRDAGLTWRVEDHRTTGTGPRFTVPPKHRPDPDAADGGALRWYQQQAVDAGLATENAVLRAPTGSGKTTSAIALAVEADVPVLVVVWTGGLFEQWETRLMRELGLRASDIGRVRGGERSIKPITIAMQQTLWRGMTPEFIGTWGMVVCDEVQRAASVTFMDVLDKFPARYRIGISADETRADRKEFLVYDLFGDVAHEVSQDDLIDEGSVLDVECRVVPTEFRADWYVAARASGTPDFNRLLGEMAEDETRNALALDLVLAEVEAGNQVLVLSHRVEHCQRFDAALAARAVPCDLMLGGDEWKGRFDATKRGLADGSLRVAAGTIQAIGTGIDLPAVGRGVLTTPIGSNRQLYGQVRGRLCRPGKADAVLYVLWDRHVHGESTLKFLTRWNRTVVVRDTDGAWLDVREYNRRQAT